MAKKLYLQMRRIPMDGIFNFRSLGGYCGVGGKVTRHGALYRSARLIDASERDRDIIWNGLQIRTVIDLREPMELQNHPDYCGNDPLFHYVNVNVMPDLNPEALEKMAKEAGESVMLRFYIQLLDNSQKKVAEVIHAVGEALCSGAVLFHCTVGRDRTGVIAMLLGGILGLDQQDLVADYQVSETYLLGFDSVRMPTPAANMEGVIAHLKEEYGGICAYLKKIGVDEKEQEGIRRQVLCVD